MMKNLWVVACTTLTGSSLSFMCYLAVIYGSHEYHSFVIHQAIDVPDLSLGGKYTGLYESDFYWSELTANKAFSREFAERVWGKTKAAGIVPYDLELSQRRGEELSDELPSEGGLSLRMLIFGIEYSDGYIKDFEAGRALLLEKLQERGIVGTPIGTPVVTYLPLRWPRRFSDLQNAILPGALPGAVAVLLISLYFWRKSQMMTTELKAEQFAHQERRFDAD